MLLLAARLSPESGQRLLYCNGVQLESATGYGIQSEVIQSRPSLDALGLSNVDIAYDFIYPLADRLLLDESGQWELSLDGGVTLQSCNLRKIIQDITGQGWRIIVDLARHEFTPNLAITWATGLGTFTTDTATGNPIENTIEETAYAVMRTDSGSGVYRLSGYFCDIDGNPINTPDGWQWGKAYPATWTDERTGLEHNGSFASTLQPEQPINPLAANAGSTLQGTFTPYGSGDSSQ